MRRLLVMVVALSAATGAFAADVHATAKATGPGGLLRFGSGEAAAEVLYEPFEAVTLTAEPEAGYFFYRWLGDVAGYGEEALTSATLALDATTVRNLRAVFLRKTGTGSATFANSAASCNWFDASSWASGEIPVAGDEVSMVIKNSNRAILLEAPTPRYKSVVFSSFDFQSALGTLSFSGWETKLEADDIVIDRKTTVTCAGGCVEGVCSNRVWLVCNNLRIDAGPNGGRVNVSDCGWAVGSGPGVTCLTKAGPTTAATLGAAYGGHGTKRCANKQSVNLTVDGVKGDYGYLMPAVYGSASYPTDPGSGGGLGPGGGAVLIQATGTVVVNGSILANATKSGFDGGKGTGSGGSICIACARLLGTNGVLQANSTFGQTAWDRADENDITVPGAGGRIAIHYDAGQQKPGDLVGVEISAAPGTLYERFKDGTRPAAYRSPTVADRSWQMSDLGTVWFSDATLPSDILGASLSGQIVSPAAFAFDDLAFTGGHVRFAAEGASLTVAGNTVISGATARVEFGGASSTNWCIGTQLRAKTPWSFTVGGDLTLAEGARLDARGAETNGLGGAGGLVKVSGAMVLAGFTNAFAVVGEKTWSVGPTAVYAWSDAFNGGSPVFEVGSLVVGSNAVLSADKRGFASGAGIAEEAPGGEGYPINGFGPGGGEAKTSGSDRGGGGHGGIGGAGFVRSGNWCGAYDDPIHPTLAGSGGAGVYTMLKRGYGGGVVNVKAQGLIRIDGRVSADGENAENFGISGGAGGTVFLECRRLVGAATGVLSAKGAGAQCVLGSAKYTGAGAGGRIAVWTGKPWSESAKAKHCIVYDDPVGEETLDYAGTVTVAGGVPTDAGTHVSELSGEPGSLRFLRYDGTPGLMLLVR